MSLSNQPFNISILELTPEKLKGLGQVTSPNIYEASSNNLHPNGLWSVDIFGRVGDERRNQRFAFIDIKLPVFHPVIFDALARLKRLHADIMAGKAYATFNKQTREFERTDANEGGKTGFYFFLQHWESIKFPMTASDKRDHYIAVVNKYKTRAMTSKVVVLPAGLRDVEVSPTGRIQKDEINDLYIGLLSVANTITTHAVATAGDSLDQARWRLQSKFNELYENLESRIKGKKNLFMGKWASRKIVNGTRNVLTSADFSPAYLGDPLEPNANSTILGLYQSMKGALPVATYALKNTYLGQIFQAPSLPVKLVDKKTLKAKAVKLEPRYFDSYASIEGLAKIITLFADESVRHTPIEIAGHYLFLVYNGPDMTYRVFSDIDEVPDTRLREHVHPITFAELMYLSTHKQLHGLPIEVTRYPVTGTESIYPSFIYIKSTIRAERRYMLNENWAVTAEAEVAPQYPIIGSPFVNAMSPHPFHLTGLSADFDGDTGSGNITVSEESKAEIARYLRSLPAYVAPDGEIDSSSAIDTTELVMHNLTMD